MKSGRSSAKLGDKLRDSTYRAIYRLESGKADAPAELRRTLHDAWRAGGSVEDPKRFRDWLGKITPLCMALLDDDDHLIR